MIRHAAAAVVLVLSASPLSAQEMTFTVDNPSTNVHLSPSTGSPVIGKAPRGKVFEVSRDLGSWVKISWPEGPDGAGYLHVTWGSLSRNGAAADANPTTGTQPPSGSPSVASVSPTAAVPVTQARTTNTVPRRAAPVSLPSHIIGLGGRLGSHALGFAATGRAWSDGPLGVQVEIGRSTLSTLTGPEQLSSMQLAPSVIYSAPDVVTNAIWVRPYVGTGLSIYRSTLTTLTPGLSEPADTGLGFQAFGGAEFTWANLPQFAVSADLRKQWAPTPFSGFELGGFGFSMSAHWYVK